MKATMQPRDVDLVWGSKIRAARSALRISQEELAVSSGVSRRTIGNIEAGRSVPQRAVLDRILVALDLLPAPQGDWPDWVRTYVEMVVPLLLELPESRRADVMRDLLLDLARAVRDGHS